MAGTRRRRLRPEACLPVGKAGPPRSTTSRSERRRHRAGATTNRREGILGGVSFGLARFFVASLLRMTDGSAQDDKGLLDSLFGLPIGWFHAKANRKRADPVLTVEDDPPDKSGALPSSFSSCLRPTVSGISASHRMNGASNFPLVE